MYYAGWTAAPSSLPPSLVATGVMSINAGRIFLLVKPLC